MFKFILFCLSASSGFSGRNVRSGRFEISVCYGAEKT